VKTVSLLPSTLKRVTASCSASGPVQKSRLTVKIC